MNEKYAPVIFLAVVRKHRFHLNLNELTLTESIIHHIKKSTHICKAWYHRLEVSHFGVSQIFLRHAKSDFSIRISHTYFQQRPITMIL